ncbi:FimV/HubP family polar landmark protein [Aquisalimonas lutea]|uniref:PFGI-1 class ICE element type IV pilus protein PilL2 n=1 Tax=Aquisalimonas lutea TaxID=1327750 RepID=UPI0025B4AC29|nr:FimV/HubP family polar landmark protein [Aquisalimonas lutea]MDN3519065.1 FimV/HubP family polar landmark protein [Aquisalimonas lutea]
MIALLAVATTAGAADGVRVGRYQTVAAEPTPAQANPLQVQVDLTFPPYVERVGDAVIHLLDRSGYRLQDPGNADPAMRLLLTRPLPAVHRDLGPLPLEDALKTLAGAPWRLVVDPTARLVSFEARAPYAEGAREKAAGLTFEPREPQPGPATYGPVDEGETLLGIAKRVAPDRPMRTALALFEANPGAFEQGSPHRLTVGATLAIPDEPAVRATDTAAARQTLWEGDDEHQRQ